MDVNKNLSASLSLSTKQYLPNCDILEQDSELKRQVLDLVRNKQITKAAKTVRQMSGKHPAHELHFLSAIIEFANNNIDSAINHATKAVSKHEKYFDGLVLLGELFGKIGQPKVAMEYLSLADALRPDSWLTPKLMGECCVFVNQLEKATVFFLESLKRDRQRWDVWQMLASVFHSQGRVDDALDCCKKMLGLFKNKQGIDPRLKADSHGSYVFYLLAKELNFKNVAQQMGIWAFENLDASYEMRVPVKRDKIRLGFVGSDFYRHAALNLYRPLIEMLDKQVFESYCFNNTLRPDETTEYMQPFFDRWFNVSHLTDEQLYKTILESEIDILIDLNGHTLNNRLTVFGKKPALIQITGLGFVSALNIPHFDFYFTDKHITTPDREKLFGEQPLYLESVMHWQNPGDDIELVEKHDGPIMFGCFNNLYKITPRVIGVWAGILKKVPGSMLTIKTKQMDCPDTRNRVLDQFESFGVFNDQIVLRGQSSHEEHMREMLSIDIMLDPFPYQGGVSTCEALYMGCPVISLNMGTRTSVSILNSCGFSNFVAQDLYEYANLAVKVGKEWKQGNKLQRQFIRDSLVNSVVCDSGRYSGTIQEILKQVHKVYLEAAGLQS